MAKHFFHGKRRGALVALSAALCATLSLGMLAACGGETNSPADDDEEETTSSATDTQLLRNGNFEYYSERDTKPADQRAYISSPTSWSFTSGSPSSTTTSGIVKADQWKEQLMKSTYRLVPDGAEEEIGSGSASFTAKTLTDDAASEAERHWNDASVYDRLLFYKYYGVDSASEFSLYDDYKYSIDYEDVQYFAGDLGNDGLTLREGVKDGETGVLMIHNTREYNNVLGTAQYYTSSTTVTLEAGTAAEISVWVRTDRLYHWFDAEHATGSKEEIEAKGGAYIGILNTVGGTSLPEMQVKNIRTDGQWEQYSFFIRANTYATTTFRIKLGLGQGTSTSDRYENVDGYAFFDDVFVKKVAADKYGEDISGLDASHICNINSESTEKIFDRDTQHDSNAYALDLLSDSFQSFTAQDLNNRYLETELTSETSGSTTAYSFIKDNRTDGVTPENEQSIVGSYTYAQLKSLAENHKYLKNVFDEDFEGSFPFALNGSADAMPVLMLFSTNGAAYTAKLTSEEFTLPANSRKLVSFFVKTWDVLTGRSGAGITLMDGTKEAASIAAFDSNKVDPVTIDKDDPALTDIYKGWVQCFFIVANETDTEKTFSLKFTYGVTSVQGTDESSYGEGYAAFTDIKVMDLTKTQYSYASTGSYAQKATLSAYAENTSKFDDAGASSNIKEELAAPVNFSEALAGSNIFVENGPENEMPAGVFGGLLRKEYAENYMNSDAAWSTFLSTLAGGATTADAWWTTLFDEGSREVNQPLVLMNTNKEAVTPFGYMGKSATISASTSQRITVRVKVAKGTTAYIYLLDTSDEETTPLAPSVPKNTYWYDDEGNILRRDPESKDFDEKTDILYYLEANGLYAAAADVDKANHPWYANLSSYKQDEDGNLVTSDDIIAFYLNKSDNKYYGYRTEVSEGKYTYSQPVESLPTTVKEDGKDVSILRYSDPAADASKYESVIKVTGTDANAGKWIDVNFYVRTGSNSKSYRVELWAGARDGSSSENSFPAGGYVFFDAYSTGTVSNFTDLRDGDTGAAGLLLGKEENQLAGDPEKLNEKLALYYTFSFFDSASYLRHDREHEEVNYNKWENYKQSDYEEGLVWLQCYDEDGSLYGKGPSYSVYLDFTPLEQTVTASEPDDVDTTTPDEDEDEDGDGQTNIWLVLSSSVLAFVTLFAVGAVLFRTIRKRHKKSAPASARRPKARKVKPASTEQTPAETPAPEEKDENDPYKD